MSNRPLALSVLAVALATTTATAHAAPVADALTPAELAPDCKLAGNYQGSLHAATAYDVPMVDPKAKTQQSVQCGVDAAVLYFFVHDEGGIRGAVAGLGGRLWGGPGPTREHSDELLIKKTTAVVVSGPARAKLVEKLVKKGFVRDTGSAAPPAPPRSADLLADLASAVQCSGATDPLRSWCPALGARKAGYKAPPAPQVYLGLAVGIGKETSIRSALLGNVNVATLVVAPGRVLVNDVKPDNANEREQLLRVAMQLAAHLKGQKAAAITVEPDFAGYLGSLKARASTGVAVADSPAGPAAYTSAHPSRIAAVDDAKLGRVYVVIEEANDGTWLNLFPAVPYATK